MTRLQWILLTVGVAVAAVLVWNAVREPYPQALWVSVEAPRYAVAGQALPMRITWQSSPAAGTVRLDLHWSDERRRPRGYLSGTNLGWMGTNAATLLVELPVPMRTNLTRIQSVLYASPTRRWADRGWVIRTTEIRVRASEAPVDAELRPLHAYEPVEDPEIRPAEIHWVRWVTGGAWVGVALGLGRGRGRAPRVLVGACLGLAVLELFSADLVLAGVLRALARGQQLYNLRRDFQQWAIVLGAVLIAAAVVWSARCVSQPRQRSVWIAIGLFTLVWSTSVFSLHETDRILALSFGFLPLVQWMKLFAVGGALAAVVGRWRCQGPRQEPEVPGLD